MTTPTPTARHEEEARRLIASPSLGIYERLAAALARAAEEAANEERERCAELCRSASHAHRRDGDSFGALALQGMSNHLRELPPAPATEGTEEQDSSERPGYRDGSTQQASPRGVAPDERPEKDDSREAAMPRAPVEARSTPPVMAPAADPFMDSARTIAFAYAHGGIKLDNIAALLRARFGPWREALEDAHVLLLQCDGYPDKPEIETKVRAALARPAAQMGDVKA